MQILHLLILTFIALVGIFSQINLLSNVEARSIAAFDWQIDEQYTRDGFVDFIVSKGSHNSLPVTVRSISNEPIMLVVHTTYNFDQTGPAKLPSGVDAFFEPTQFRLEPNQSKQVELVINVDENAPSNLYDLQIVGTWEEEGKTPDFMGSSIRLHVGRDYGIGKIPVNMLDPPLKFWKYAQNDKDVTIYDTSCRNDYVLVVKAKDGSPACVNYQTKPKLIQRYWASLDHPINSKLLPVRPLRVSYDEFAGLLMGIKGDSILEKQESESKITFITNMGKIEINKDLKSPAAVYTINKNPINMTDIDVVEYSKSILEDIGYTQDGTESITSIGSPWDSRITFTQLINGVYQNSHHTTFYFNSDYTKIELGRWYENISKIGFLVSHEDAKKIAYQYMQLEIEKNSELQQRNMKAQIPTFLDSLQIVDDRIAYYLDAAVGPNNHPEVDSPNYIGVLVDVMTGKVLDWNYGGSAV